jgi:hypothetical protein
MSRIILTIAEYGAGIRDVADTFIAECPTPIVVEMHFNGGTVHKKFSPNCATEGSHELALEYLHYLEATHDVFYDYSDDARVWRAGQAEADRIRDVKKILTERNILKGA